MDEITQMLFGMEGFAVLAAVIIPLDGELGVETINPGHRVTGGPDRTVDSLLTRRRSPRGNGGRSSARP